MYKTNIGLEIHVELNTRSKMFCSCLNDPNEHRPNVNICPICMGHPGTLPVINKKAVRLVTKVGLALHSQISEYCRFDRKNYFYPDLPKGYQISQYHMPLCKGGFLVVDGRKIMLTRIHLEEDTGRLMHSEDENYSLVDFNRAGVPLMELVTEPDLKSPKEARKFAEQLQLILRYLRVSDADMEKGQMRIEVNISLTKTEKLGTKVEIKNLNSFRAVEQAIEYEIKRQTEILQSGKKVNQETRGWDAGKRITVSQRTKERAHDYRYFPEPDLPMLHLGVPEYLQGVQAEIPELPGPRGERLKQQYKISDKEAHFFVVNKDMGEYFEKVISELQNWLSIKGLKAGLGEQQFQKATGLAAHYIISDLQALLKEAAVPGEDFLITPENFAEFISLIFEKRVTSKTAKKVLREMFQTGRDPSDIVEQKKLAQLTDKVQIEKIIQQVISQNPKPVEDFKQGKENAIQFLVGKVMSASRGKANPNMVHAILKQLLAKSNKI